MPDTPHDDELLARARDYVQAHRGTYTDEALRERMIRDGVPAALADHALGEASPYGSPGPAAWGALGSPARPRTRLILFTVATLSVVASAVIFVGAGALFWNSENIWGFLITCAAGLAAECVAAAAYARRTPGLGPFLLVAIALTPVAVAVLLVGGCVALVLVSLSGLHH